ncbi:hypothetical protein VTN02DRAFT_6770 [Thermoascus thermophilus]
MAQGEIKKKSTSTSSAAKRSTALAPKRGPRHIAPKKPALVRQAKMTKKLTAGLIAKTERSLAERAGHLELLKGGRKEKKNQDKQNGKEGGKKQGKN